MRLIKVYLPILLLIGGCRAIETKPPGWLWYSPVTKVVEPETKQPEVAATKQLSKLQQRFKTAKAKAILQPTYNNVQRFFLLQAQMIRQAEQFQKMYQLVSTMQPPRADDNPNPVYQRELKQLQATKLQTKLKQLSQTHGLFFIYKSDCPYCHEFAPIVKRFARAYGFVVKAVSADGQPIEQFPDAVPDNGAVSRINPEGIYPSLFLANPKTGLVVPLSWGMSSWLGLHDNAQVLIETLERQHHA